MRTIIKTLATAALMALPLAFTACDDDVYYYDAPWWYSYRGNSHAWDNNDWNDDNDQPQGTTTLDEAQVLAGEWNGTMVYTTVASNGTQEQSEFYANMTFTQNNSQAIKGTGTEIDTDHAGNSQVLKFNWYIDEETGNIHLRYTTSGMEYVMDAQATQHGFFLDEAKGTFQGYLIGTNNNDMAYINLSRVTANAKGQAGTPATSTRTFGSKLVQQLEAVHASRQLPRR